MIKVLKLVFLGMFIYGAWAGLYGPGLIAFGVAVFLHFADWHFKHEDSKFYQSTQYLSTLNIDTCDALKQHECECTQLCSPACIDFKEPAKIS